MEPIDAQDTPLETIADHALRDIDGDDLNAVYAFVTYMKTGDRTNIESISTPRVRQLCDKYGHLDTNFARAMTTHMEERNDSEQRGRYLQDARSDRRHRWAIALAAAGIAIASAVVGWLYKRHVGE